MKVTKKKMSKKQLINLVRVAYFILIATIIDIVPNLFERIIILLSLSVIAGAQLVCLQNQFPDERTGDSSLSRDGSAVPLEDAPASHSTNHE